MLQSGVQVSISEFHAAEWGPGVNYRVPCYRVGSRCQLWRSILQSGVQVSISAFHAGEWSPSVN